MVSHLIKENGACSDNAKMVKIEMLNRAPMSFKKIFQKNNVKSFALSN